MRLKGDRNRKTTSTLLSLGAASALVYLLAFTLPYWLPAYYLDVQDEIYQFTARESWRGLLFYAALAVLFGLYLAACRLVARADRLWDSPWPVGLWTLLFCLLLIPVYPITSSDVYGYVFQGRILAALGENPFAHLYKDFATDPFYFCVTFHNLPATTGYGPLWVAIEAGLGWLARDRLLLNLCLFKGLAGGLHLLSSFLVYATLKRVVPEKRVAGMLVYAWNPVLLYELVGNAHNDATVAVLALLGFYLLSRNRGMLAIPCLALAALVKPVAVLWLPLAAVWLIAQCSAWPGRLRRAGAIAALAILPAVMAYAPFWVGETTFRGVLAQSDIHGNSLPNLLIVGIWSVWPDALAQIVQNVKLLTVLVFAMFCLWQISAIWRAVSDPRSALHSYRLKEAGEVQKGIEWESLVRASFDVMLFYLLFVGFQFWPWYLTWLVIPAALLDEPAFGPRRLLSILLCLTAPLLYFPFGWQWARSSLPAWGAALLAALPMVGLCVWLGVRTWRSHRSGARKTAGQALRRPGPPNGKDV